MNTLTNRLATHETAIASLVSEIYELIKPYNPQHAECFISERFHRELNIKAFLGGFTNKENSTFKLVRMLADELKTRQECVTIINSMLEA